MKKREVQFHREGYGGAFAAVNVKVYDAPESADFVDVAMNNGYSNADALQFAEWAEGFEDPDSTCWQAACESEWENLQNDAEWIYGEKSGIKVYSEGRSGGWAVLRFNSDDVEGWDAIALGKWARFVRCAEACRDDTPRMFAELVLLNVWEPMQEEKRKASTRLEAQRNASFYYDVAAI